MALAHIQDARERANHGRSSSEAVESSRELQERESGRILRYHRNNSAACKICVASPARPGRPEAFPDFPIFEDHRMQTDDKGDLLIPSRDSTSECVRSREEIASTAEIPAVQKTPRDACKTHTLVYSTPERGRETWLPASIMQDRCPAPPPTPQGVRVYSTPPPARCRIDRTPCSGGVPEERKACDVLMPLASSSARENTWIHENLGQQDSAIHAWRGLVTLSGKRMDMKSQPRRATSPSPQRLSHKDPSGQENVPCVLANSGGRDCGVAFKSHARSD